MKSKGPLSDRCEGGPLNRTPPAHALSHLNPSSPYSWFTFVHLIPRDPGTNSTTSEAGVGWMDGWREGGREGGRKGGGEGVG